MSSIIKVGKVQSSTGQDAVTIADSGAITANGALTASGGIANAGTISAGSISSSVTGFTGAKVVDTWRLNTEFGGVANPIQNWTRATESVDGSIGTAMDLASGVFTFPMPGIYYIEFRSLHQVGLANANIFYSGTCINKVISGSTTNICQSYACRGNSYNSSSSNFYYINHCSIVFDCTDVETHKVSFAQNDLNTGEPRMLASTTSNTSAVMFTRIGDT